MGSWSPRDLAGRLRLALSLLLPLMLGVTAMVLDQAFERSLKAGLSEQLRLQTYVLMGAAEAGGGELWMPPRLEEPRFQQPGSGLYGFVYDAQGALLWRSASAPGLRLGPSVIGSSSGDDVFGTTATGHFYYQYPVTWETEDGRETPLTFAVLLDPQGYEAERRGFQWLLWSGMLLLAALLLGIQGLVLRWGLRPLKYLAEDIKAIENGHVEHLKGPYPREVRPLTENLNLLLAAEQRRRQTVRNRLADLAHSLKTPLSVLYTLEQHQPRPETREQLERMKRILDHQLGEALPLPAHRLLGRVPVRPAVERLGRALQSIYREPGVNFRVRGDSPSFRGDEEDLLEVLGNLLDNAFKYGGGQVSVEVQALPGEVALCIEDNGPGIAPELRAPILARGMRADTRCEGQGIGLAVVMEKVRAYHGSLEIKDAALGGAAFSLRLPGGDTEEG